MEDCMLDFDIDLLQSAYKTDTSALEHNIRRLKKRIIASTSLLKRYQVKQAQCLKLKADNEKIQINIRESTDVTKELQSKCQVLEKEVSELQKAKVLFENKYIETNDKYGGSEANVTQFKALVDQTKNKIENLEIDYELEKAGKEDYIKQCKALEKENDYLIKNIQSARDIVFGKKKATKGIKAFFNKYKKPEDANKSREETSADETDNFDECHSPFLDPGMYNNKLGSPAGDKNNIAEKLQSISINEVTRDDNDHDSESSNGIVSLDTGRGSSLAFSDSDKGSVLSPEYFINSPPSTGGVNKEKNVVSVATSPIRTREFTSVATSPIIFTSSHSEQMVTEESDQLINTFNERISNAFAPVVMVDREVSPILTTQNIDVSTITDRNTNCDVATSPLKADNRPTVANGVSDHNIQENDWMVTDDSNNVGDENSNDGEIQRIFDSMRFHDNLITPIPSTPAKPRSDAASVVTNHSSSDINVCRDTTLQGNVVSLREDVDKILHVMNTDPMKLKVMVDYIKELNEAMTVYNQQLQTKTNLVQNKDAFVAINRQLLPKLVDNKDAFVADQDAGVTKKVESFKSKMTKMKELFDDSSPPSPIDGISPLRPIKWLPEMQSPPSHAAHLLPPPFTSAVPAPSITLSPVSRCYESPFALPVTPVTRSPSAMRVSLMSPVPESPSPRPPTPVSPTPMSCAPVTASRTLAPVSPSPISHTSMSHPPVSPCPMSPVPVSPSPMSRTSMSHPPVSPSPMSPVPVSPSPMPRTSMSHPPVSPSPMSPVPVSPSPMSRTSMSHPPVSPCPMSPVPVSPSPMSRTSMSHPPVSPSPMSPVPVYPSPKSSVSVPTTPRSASPVLRSPSPTPVSLSKALTHMSPNLTTPPSTISDQNLPSNNGKQDVSFNSKERLHFEDALPNDESSDDASYQEIIYQNDIVMELTPEIEASDKDDLHNILQEQLEQRSNTKDVSPEIENVTYTPKQKKVSKLEKLRKNLVPKSKIKNPKLRERKPKAKLRIQPKRLTANKQRVLLDSDCSVDPKVAYETARKIMAELKANEKPSNNVVPGRMSTVREKRVNKLAGGDQLSKYRRIETGNLQHIQALKTSPTFNSISKSVRTSSQNKSINDDKEYNSEAIQFNSIHLKSSSLKSYGRNRIAHKPQTKLINNNDASTTSLVQDDNVMQSFEGNMKEVAIIETENRKPLKRPLVDTSDVVSKIIKCDSTVSNTGTEKGNLNSQPNLPVEKIQIPIGKQHNDPHKDIISYDDLDLFEDTEVNKQQVNNSQQEMPNNNQQRVINTQATSNNNYQTRHAGNPERGILSTFIDRYGNRRIKREVRIPETVIDGIFNRLDESITEIQKLPSKDATRAMDALVKDLQYRSPKYLLTALIKYLKDPTRKNELFNKKSCPPGPPMTKVEQILMYIVDELDICWPTYNLVDKILECISYTLFALNRTPDFDVIETLSRFYAIVCRYNNNINRLRLFIVDAMYCLHFKAVPLIRQCLDVWMHILPLAHMRTAQSPLVMSLVYLLHFFKCEDRFNRVQDIRNILRRKYFYEVSEWNETRILDVFRNSILEVKDIPIQKKMLRMALIILAKRNGARWCQQHIITNTLLPIIQNVKVPERVKLFCVSILGPLLKPYPLDMKVNCEIIMNQLFEMLKLNPSRQMEEAIYTSLIYMSRHNHARVVKALFCWKPEQVSPDLGSLLKNFVHERPVNSWKAYASKIFIYDL